MATLTIEQVRAIQAVTRAILEAVRSQGDEGCPGGLIYAALMAQGCSLEQYHRMMDGLVRVGKLTRRGELYFAAEQKAQVQA